MHKVPFKNPQPDINNFIKVIKSESIPSRGVVMEYLMYEEVRRKISRELLGLDWVEPLEDEIIPVNKFYKKYSDKIAVLGSMHEKGAAKLVPLLLFLS